jgi:hypothetical protein
MKHYLLAVIGILLGAHTLYAQNARARLLVQSPDGKKVMLLWLLSKWDGDITGFDIKRKDGIDGWVKLNSQPIMPGISMKKDPAIVNADKEEVNKLKARLFKLLTSRKLSETENAGYLQSLANDKALHDMNDMMLHDYEIAQMNGFAYIDYTATKKTDYQYGVFIQGTDIMLAKASWNYGEIPDMNTVKEITSKRGAGTTGVRVMWNADVNKMKAANVAGFNIYRQGIRLNDFPIMATGTGDPSEFAWDDRSANGAYPIQYSISAESIFGIEGIIRSYTYDPANHPDEYRKAEVTEVTPMGYYFKEGINVKWNFPKEYERFIKGFYLEKNNMPGSYVRVSPLIEPAARTYTDKTPSSVSSYIRYRVVAVYNDRTLRNGIEQLYNYFPGNEPPQPQNLIAAIETANKKDLIHLHWDAPIKGDNITAGYVVYNYSTVQNKYVPLNIDHPVKTTNYDFPFIEGSASQYKFYVIAVSKSGAESVASDTVTISMPQSILPPPTITKVFPYNGRAGIQWQYTTVSNLKGFRVFQNKMLIANESELDRNTREFVTPKLATGTYSFTIQAISMEGALSDYSKQVPLRMP